MKTDPQAAAGRAFVRSLNILLKLARLYGHEHARTIEQLQTAWQELRTAIPMGTDSALLLGATNSQLLLDGVPLEGSPAEKQFAQLLSAAGVASVQFFAFLTEEEIGRFVRAFPTGKAKPAELALQLKAALADAQGIRINEICFVATDARLKDVSIAAQIAAASLDGDQEQFRQWLNDPQKLLELIAAAQGSKSGGVAGPGPGGLIPDGEAPGTGDSAAGGGTSAGTRRATGLWNAGGSGVGFVSEIECSAAVGSVGVAGAGFGAGEGSGSGGHGEPSEEEIYGILSALTSFGTVGTGQGGVAAAGGVSEEKLPIAGRAPETPKQKPAKPAGRTPQNKTVRRGDVKRGGNLWDT